MKFKSDIEVQAGLKDSSGALGLSGQILSSTSGNVSWVTPTVNTVARDVQNEVKAGVAINKGQAVYVTGADGTNIIVGLASNATEATSSKTLGLLNATVAVNGFADVVQIGRLSGLNTLGATAGDPVWLGTGGNLIYGLINKPYAPANLVFIGIVTRVNVNNGEIFVSVQNGFELNEIHDVDLKTTVPINGDILGFNGTLWVNKTIAQWLGYTPANASGTTNYVSKFTGTTTLGNSQIFDNGTNVGIGTSSPTAKLSIGGVGSALSFDTLGAPGTTEIKTIQDYELSIKNNRGTSTEILVGNEILKFSTSESERMRITSGGNVGIGTTAPSYKLDVQGTGTSTPLRVVSSGNTSILLSRAGTTDNGDATLTVTNSGALNVSAQNVIRMVPYSSETARFTNTGLGIGTTAPNAKLEVSAGQSFINQDYLFGWNVAGSTTLRAYIIGTSGNELQFWNRQGGINTQAITLNASGNVGIGTASPAAKLHINNASTVATNFLAGNNNGGTYFGWDSDNTGLISTYTSAPIKFGGNYASSFNEWMRISNTGNVGIGTSAPGAKLDVRGSTYIRNDNTTNQLTIDNDSVGTNASPQYSDILFGGYSGTLRARIRGVDRASNTTIGGLILQSSTDGTTLVDRLFLNGNGESYFYNNSSEVMRISTTGNVGIGTTSPASPLDVQCDSTALGINIRQRTGNDFSNLSFSSNTNTALGSISYVGTSRLRFTTNGFGDVNEKLSILANGNVGIGTANPQANLQINSATGTNSTIAFSVNNTLTWYNRHNASTGSFEIVDVVSATPRLVIQNNGNVGVGTTAPNSKLEVYDGDISVTTANTFSFLNSNRNFIPNTAGVSLGALRFRGYSTGTTYQVGAGVYSFSQEAWTSTSTPGYLSFQTTTAGSTSPSEKMVISSSGAARLNSYGSGSFTGTATQKLAVDGSGNIIEIPIGAGPVDGSGTTNFVTKWTDSDTIGNSQIFDNGTNVGIGTSSPSQKLDVNGVAKANSFTFNASSGSGNWQIGSDSSIDSGKGMYIYNSLGDYRISIKENGNVGIGTTSPTEKLEVSGNIKLTNNNNAIQFFNDAVQISRIAGNAMKIDSYGGWQFYDVSGATERMRIAASGNVGIGTSSPARLLELSAGEPTLRFNPTSVSGAYIFTAADGKFYFTPESTYVSTMTFSSGNVGIGTTTPTQKLDVVGNAKVSGSVQVGDDSATASATNVGATRYRSDANNSYMDMVMQTGASTYAWVNVVQNNW